MDRRTALQSLAGAAIVAAAGCLTNARETSRLDRYTEVDGGEPGNGSDRSTPDRTTETPTPEPLGTTFVDTDVYEDENGYVAVDVAVENQGTAHEDVVIVVAYSNEEMTDERPTRVSLAPGDHHNYTVTFDVVYGEWGEGASIDYDIREATQDE